MAEHAIDGVILPGLIHRKPKRSRRRIRWFLLCVVVIIAGVTAWIFVDKQPNHQPTAPKISDPIPLSVRNSVDFSLYYPNPSKLPNGFSLNKQSISSGSNVVIMSVSDGNGPIYNISEQSLPPADELQKFYANRIPLRTSVSTPIGQASVAAVNNQTFASITTNSTWVIVTGPLNANSTQLDAILKSLAPTEN